MVALDLDGTLLQSNHQIADVQADYLRSLHNRGFTVCIATGRAAPSIYETVRRLNFPTPIPVVCSNGARGFYCGVNSEKEELFYNPVPESAVHEALRISKKVGCALQFYFDDAIYSNASTDPVHLKYTELYHRLTGSEITYVTDDFKSLLEEGKLPSKLLAIFDENSISEVGGAYQAELGSKATIVFGAFDWFLEILNPQVTKGDGLKNMCQNLNIPIEQCIAMGMDPMISSSYNIPGWVLP